MIPEFGKAIRRARVELGVTLSEMATETEVRTSTQSGLETGRWFIEKDDVERIDQYFKAHKLVIPNLRELADHANADILAGKYDHLHNLNRKEAV